MKIGTLQIKTINSVYQMTGNKLCKPAQRSAFYPTTSKMSFQMTKTSFTIFTIFLSTIPDSFISIYHTLLGAAVV